MAGSESKPRVEIGRENDAAMSQSTHNGRTYRYAGTEHLAESEYHRLFSAARRRALLDVLAESTAPLGFEELVATVAARERGADVVFGDDVERVAISLQHVHLPMTTDLGVVDEVTDPNRV